MKYESFSIDFVTFHLNKSPISISTLNKNPHIHFLAFDLVVHVFSIYSFQMPFRLQSVTSIVALHNFCCRMYLIFPSIFTSFPRIARPILLCYFYLLTLAVASLTLLYYICLFCHTIYFDSNGIACRVPRNKKVWDVWHFGCWSFYIMLFVYF